MKPPGVGSTDPQVAVGRKYVLAVDTGRLSFYNRNTSTWLNDLPRRRRPSTPSTTPPTLTAADLFKPMFKEINLYMSALGVPRNVCDPDNPKHNDLFDPANPDANIPGNVDEVYDTRPLYDPERRRFWIAAHVRNQLWPCPDKYHPDTGAQIGGFGKALDGTLKDPDPEIDETKKWLAKNHTNWDPTWAHRFIAVAVTQGEEDLSLPFLKYILVDEYADWPLMTVSGDLLVLSHRAGPPYKQVPPRGEGQIYVFNASQLASGEQDGAVMKIEPAAPVKKRWERVGFKKVKSVKQPGRSIVPSVTGVVPNSPILLANSHGASDSRVVVLEANGALSLAFVISATKKASGIQVWYATGEAIDLGFPIFEGGSPTCSPVFRDGRLYVSTNRKDDATRQFTRVIRLPVWLNANRTEVHHSKSPTDGFLQFDIGNHPEDLLTYLNPSVDVNQNGDMVVAYARVGLKQEQRQGASVRYDVYYHDETQVRHSQALKAGDQWPSTFWKLANQELEDVFFTASIGLRDMATQLGYSVEGNGEGAVFADPRPGNKPLYHLYNASTKDRLYTTSETERTDALANGYSPRPIVCYVFATSGGGTSRVAFRRFTNLETGRSFYTTNDVDANYFKTIQGFTETIVCWLLKDTYDLPPTLGSMNIDLPGTAVDPEDDETIWIANARWTLSGLSPVIGAVKP